MRRGFTILEITIAMGVTSLVALALGAFMVSVFRTTRAINSTLSSNEQGRRTVLNFVQELRTASPSSIGSYPIAAATANSLTFYSDVDLDAYKERLRYYVDGTTLKRGVLKPSGSPLAYNPANELVTDVARYITNPTDIFSYFNEDYDGQSAPLSIPPNIPDIRLIRVRLQIDELPNEPPAAYEILSEVNLRNLKDNL